jgi:hypothetical protein
MTNQVRNIDPKLIPIDHKAGYARFTYEGHTLTVWRWSEGMDAGEWSFVIDDRGDPTEPWPTRIGAIESAVITLRKIVEEESLS